MHLQLVCRGGGVTKGQGSSVTPLQIITQQLNDLHSAIGINNAQHIVDEIRTHWGEANIRKKTQVIHHQVCEVQALKTTRPIVLLESQGPVLGR